MWLFSFTESISSSTLFLLASLIVLSVSWDLSDGKSRDHLPINMVVGDGGWLHLSTCYLL